MRPIVSDYGATKPEEFYAEAFMNYWLKRKLPKTVHSAIKQSLKTAKRNGLVGGSG